MDGDFPERSSNSLALLSAFPEEKYGVIVVCEKLNLELKKKRHPFPFRVAAFAGAWRFSHALIGFALSSTLEENEEQIIVICDSLRSLGLRT